MNRITPIVIDVASAHPTIAFAAAELQRYLARATGRSVEVLNGATPDGQAVIRLGLASDIPGAALPPAPERTDDRFDDAISIAVHADSGLIAGNNPRSVLLAVYRFLHMLGCRWVRPGDDGEYIPPVDLAQRHVVVLERPAYRHRGICIEGAVSFEHVRDLIDWMPKVGLSAYFVQFREAFAFFDRWYSHRGHPTRAQDALTVAEARMLVGEIAREAKQRDLLYHAVGHGWTCEPFGIAGLGWEYPSEPAPPESVQYLALVNGKRALWDGIPLNTSLCYSNLDVRRIMTDAVAEYARQHPEVDLLHFWLADGTNNQCECDACAGTRPSDFYMMMLNELDAKLTALQLDVRIVFLAYFDLLWPPERERIHNLDRFVMMFAPITRTYCRPFMTDAALPTLPPFERNRLSFPQDIAQNMAFLRAWQAQYPEIDSFDFDYHLMWDHYRDPAYSRMAEILRHDLQLLRGIGLDGFISCQVQRAFFPTGLPMTLMGWTLWDTTRDAEAMARDYFAAAFGPDGAAARAYLARLSQFFDPEYLRGERPDAGAQAAAALAQVDATITEFLPTMQRNLARDTLCWARSWHYLLRHAEIARGLAAALRERALGRPVQARAAWDSLAQRAWELEEDLHPVFDTYLFTHVYKRMFGE
jgi:hypothetical protein